LIFQENPSGRGQFDTSGKSFQSSHFDKKWTVIQTDMIGLSVALSMQNLLKTEDCNYYNSLPCPLARRSATFITVHEILSSDNTFITVWAEQIEVAVLLQALLVRMKKNVLHIGS
jgi:hypothetical protein